ncbi:MAG: hypothetical protein Q8P23_00850 [bacterium]|nr:hypothetical protein [bacterium]
MYGRPGQFNPSFEPLWQQGDVFTIVRADKTETIRVLQVMMLPAARYDGGTLTSASSLDLAPTVMQLGSSELGQFRFFVRDTFEVDIEHPSGSVQYWRARSQQYRIQPWFLDPTTPDELRVWMWAASEFFVWSDRSPTFNCYKLNSVASVELYFTFCGIKYITKVLEDAELKQLLADAEAGIGPMPETLWVDGLSQAGSGKGSA